MCQCEKNYNLFGSCERLIAKHKYKYQCHKFKSKARYLILKAK